MTPEEKIEELKRDMELRTTSLLIAVSTVASILEEHFPDNPRIQYFSAVNQAAVTQLKINVSLGNDSNGEPMMEHPLKELADNVRSLDSYRNRRDLDS